MRRISVEYAKPGMELASALYDKWGNMLMQSGSMLSEKHLRLLPQKGVREILIEDHRVDDVTWDPLVKQDTQREAVEAMRELITLNQHWSGARDAQNPALTSVRLKLESVGFAVSQEVLKSVMGEPDLSGCVAAEDYLCVQPVQATILAVLLAKEMGFSENDILNVGKAAMLQNLGYAWVPPQILKKTAPLTAEETREFENHPGYSAKILGQYGQTPSQVIEAVLQHHEKWNGSGYPGKVRGWDISPLAQTVCIADTYYDLVSDRPGRPAYKQMDAFEYIMAFGGELFDPEVVKVFSRRVPIYSCGVMVKLTTGEVGIISDANLGHIGRPRVRIVKDTLGNEVSKPFDMDLSQSEYQYKLIAQILEI